MQYYDLHPVQLNRDCYLIPAVEPEIKAQIISLLIALQVPQNKWNDYLQSKSVYSFLEVLYKDGYDQVIDILKAIDEQRSIGTLGMVFCGLFVATLVGLLLSSPAFSGVLAVLNAFIKSEIGPPSISLIYTGVVAAFSIYQTQFDNKKPLINRFVDNLFLLTASTLRLIAHGVLIASAGIINPAIGALLIIASIIDVLKEVIKLTQKYVQHSIKPPISSNNPLLIEQTNVRHEFSYIKHRYALLINIAASLCSVGLVCLTCFNPGNIFITAIAGTLMGVIYTAKILTQKKNEHLMRDQLQQKLKELNHQYQKKPQALFQDEKKCGQLMDQREDSAPQSTGTAFFTRTRATPVNEYSPSASPTCGF